MRIGIVGLLHESNTFVRQPTTIEQFRAETLLTGESIVEHFADAHHEMGGFIAQLNEMAGEGVEGVPLFAARAIPSGTISRAAHQTLVEQMLSEVSSAGELDGVLVAPHGATVSEDFPDADGYWLSRLRQLVGSEKPIIGTIDPHANLSPAMVENCNALIAYRTNPHLDQRQRGCEAARLIVRTCRGETTPRMAAFFPPLAINIEKQCTSEAHLQPLYQLAQRQLAAGAATNSIVLGFPYADVAEMGSSVIAVSDGDASRAIRDAQALSKQMWDDRQEFAGDFVSVEEAVLACEQLDASRRTCLLDMGDNVGGGSPADGTLLLSELHRRRVPNYFVCLRDPAAVEQCEEAGVSTELSIEVGGKTDDQHGEPATLPVRIVSMHEGKFEEREPRHGGIARFDQGRTAIVQTPQGGTVMLTTRRVAPFSLQQLRSCDLDPGQFDVLVAKGVNAPIAAYREVCNHFIRVNTDGSTCADMRRLEYRHRRRPMFPFEPDTQWSPKPEEAVLGWPSKAS